jgi:hypothetical protein
VLAKRLVLTTIVHSNHTRTDETSLACRPQTMCWSQTESSKFLQVVAGAPIAYGIEQVGQAPCKVIIP